MVTVKGDKKSTPGRDFLKRTGNGVQPFEAKKQHGGNTRPLDTRNPLKSIQLAQRCLKATRGEMATGIENALKKRPKIRIGGHRSEKRSSPDSGFLI